MVVLVMYLMRLTVIGPILDRYGLGLQVDGAMFILLVLATLLITAAGYLINDYHDVKADRINHPDRVVVDIHIARRRVMQAHVFTNMAGAAIGIFLSIYFRLPWLALIFIFTPVFLWIYSARLKHLAVVGNLTVAVLTGLVPLLVVLFEYPLLVKSYPEFVTLVPGGFRIILFWTGSFAFFAFMTTLIREIVKDAEDLEGDTEAGSVTLPVSRGLQVTRKIIAILVLITMAVLAFFFASYLHDPASLAYAVTLLGIPLLALLLMNRTASTQQQFHRMSILLKMIMLFGLAYAPVAHFLIRMYL